MVRENPIYKWMMTGGTPILGNHGAAKSRHLLAEKIWNFHLNTLGSPRGMAQNVRKNPIEILKSSSNITDVRVLSTLWQ